MDGITSPLGYITVFTVKQNPTILVWARNFHLKLLIIIREHSSLEAVKRTYGTFGKLWQTRLSLSDLRKTLVFFLNDLQKKKTKRHQ